MKISTHELFTTIRTEGGLLPADLLQRIARGDSELEGLTPASYHLAANERLNEVISRTWSRLLNAWTSFRSAAAKLPEHDHGTSITRERWLLILFHELGYGRLLPAKATEINDKPYPISHFWQNTPIHLAGFRIDLDQRIPGIVGASRKSPHSLLQEFLNRSENHLWGFVSNGLCLRILRDNVSLTRQAYIEFDLEGMMEGEVYADFVLLWLLCHQSRIEAEKPEECWLEQWLKTAQKQGIRALDNLRQGVEKAISALGRGFLNHPDNTELRQKLYSGTLSPQDYYRQLLRLVYRLLFLFAAEDRNLLLDSKADPAARERYTRFYSTARLRRLAEKQRGTKHPDVYQGLRLVMEQLGSDNGCPGLALPALGSFLWSPEAIPDLSGCDMANHDLLEAVRSLAFTIEGKVFHAVDYKNLGSEELGSIYESLLELHPKLNLDTAAFELDSASGHERKTTGSYYTPTSLIQCLLDSALDPVLEEATRKPNAEQAILSLKVCDPACGSGHFLIAAAHRIAKRLAAVRTGDEEPSPMSTHKALRDVIGHCIYGVDINPMAVELCKINLWMESLEPGKPLSFLDHRIRCGNSLLGTTPALIKNGIPDEAFKPITGDDKDICQLYKKQNQNERRGQGVLFDAEGMPWNQLGNLASAMVNLDNISDDTIEGIQQKQAQYERLVHSSGYLFGHILADAWCAAFVWPKRRGTTPPITEDVFRRIEKNPHSILPDVKEEIMRLALQYQFFHWHLEFPDVFRVTAKGEQPENEQTGWSGGFDVMLGNPPWERIQFEERTFFADKRPDISAKKNQSVRRGMIAELCNTDPSLFQLWQNTSRHIEGEAYLLRCSERFPLSAVDKFNLYAVFLELSTQIYNATGYVGIIVKAGYISDSLCAKLFSSTMKNKQLAAVAEFENKYKIFPAVHPQERFALATIAHNVPHADFAFDLRRIEELSDKHRHIPMSYEDVLRLSPNTENCPKFSDLTEYQITKRCYERFPALHSEKAGENPWGVSIDRYINVTDFSDSIILASDLDDNTPVKFDANYSVAPLYEGKLFCQFDHRYATYISTKDDPAVNELSDKMPDQQVSFYRFIPAEIAIRRNPSLGKFPGILVVRDITNRTNERGVIAAIIPENITDYTVRVIQLDETTAERQLILLSILNSFVFDYLARQRIGGTHLSNYILKQLPIPIPGEISLLTWEFIVLRSLELTYTGWDMESFAKNCGCYNPPFRWDEERRFLIRCELDAVCFHLYGVKREEIAYIMETFPIVRKKDSKYGEYRTKRVILEIYDAIQKAMETGMPYQTIVNPPPADPAVAHPSRTVKQPVRIDPTFPRTEAEKFWCAATLEIIHESPNIALLEILDIFYLVTHQEDCEYLLTQKDKVKFRQALQNVPPALFSIESQQMDWYRVRDYLNNAKAIDISDRYGEQRLSAGTDYTKIRNRLYLEIAPIISFALKATKELIARTDTQSNKIKHKATQWKRTA